ncbi:hypothetical protein HMPREF0576_1265 [Mobiluncus holmesii ATCC 35242]|uniref:Uncharacterized protein n=1 Tax=Mobiluncus holmesii ATCC 35242 TaxID=887899 RepID=E6M4M5_9ACTO|nr:hypothetical protein HMPREF0576_1265 [Mobiluncus holmesii ATCC 35242]
MLTGTLVNTLMNIPSGTAFGGIPRSSDLPRPCTATIPPAPQPALVQKP